MIEDILQSTKQTVSERLSSPLIGAFLISWTVWNWKFLVILFSDASVTTTFDLINRYAFPDITTIFLKGVVLPLTTSLAYVFFYPYPARFVYEFTLKRQREINEIKQRIADETPLTLEKSRQLRAYFIEHDRRSTEIIQKLTEENISLKATLDSNLKSKSNNPGALPETNRPHDIIEPSQLELLRLLEKIGEPVSEAALIGKAGEDKVKIKFDFGELIRKRLIKHIITSSGNKVDLTHEGRGELLDNRDSDFVNERVYRDGQFV